MPHHRGGGCRRQKRASMHAPSTPAPPAPPRNGPRGRRRSGGAHASAASPNAAGAHRDSGWACGPSTPAEDAAAKPARVGRRGRRQPLAREVDFVRKLACERPVNTRRRHKHARPPRAEPRAPGRALATREWVLSQAACAQALTEHRSAGESTSRRLRLPFIAAICPTDRSATSMSARSSEARAIGRGSSSLVRPTVASLAACAARVESGHHSVR